MIRATVRPSHEGFARLTEELEARIVLGLEEAAAVAAEVAQANTTIDLKARILHAHGVEDGYSSGIKTDATGTRGTRIAEFFDQGTLGRRKKPTKRPGKSSWTVRRRGGAHTAHRHDVAGKGIKPQRFFGKARAAGRAALLAAIHRPR